MEPHSLIPSTQMHLTFLILPFSHPSLVVQIWRIVVLVLVPVMVVTGEGVTGVEGGGEEVRLGTPLA